MHLLILYIYIHKAANSVHSNIEVDLRFSESKIDFLDVTISIENGFLTTDLYAKPTDKHMYLNRNSSHPETTKSAIPYGLGIRAKRICSSNDRYKSRRTEIKRHLVKRGYGDGEVEHQLSRVDSLDRKDLLEYKNKTNKNNDRVPIVLTFSRGLPSVNKILRNRHQTLLNSDRLSEIFPKQPIIALEGTKIYKTFWYIRSIITCFLRNPTNVNHVAPKSVLFVNTCRLLVLLKTQVGRSFMSEITLIANQPMLYILYIVKNVKKLYMWGKPGIPYTRDTY